MAAQKTDEKEPKWCPLIYIDDPKNPGKEIGIKIKNAYEQPDDLIGEEMEIESENDNTLTYEDSE